MISKTKRAQQKDIKSFSYIVGIIVILFFGVLLPWSSDVRFPYWPWLISFSLILSAWFYFPIVLPLYIAWLKLGQVLGWINVRIILGVAFISLIIPTAVVVLICRYDLLNRKIDSSVVSYRQKSDIRSILHMEKPY